MSKAARVSAVEWERRAKELLRDNIGLQQFGQKCVDDMRLLNALAGEQLDKTRLMILPGVQAMLKRVQAVAKPYEEMYAAHQKRMAAQAQKQSEPPANPMTPGMN